MGRNLAKFFADLIDQLDFALDHVILEDINYKRLALILVDNVMELTLHRYAGARSAENRYHHDNPKHDLQLASSPLSARILVTDQLREKCARA